MDKSLVELRKIILDLVHKGGEGHFPSSFSVLEVIYYLYSSGEVSIDDFNSGLFILSKGHAALALYAVLFKLGVISEEDLFSYCRSGSVYAGHPSHSIPGIPFSTGSLGHGINYALGIVLGRNALGSNAKVFCLIGDGELNEGTVWESLSLIEGRRLSSLVLIVDNNRSTGRCLTIENMKAKFSSFGFHVEECDGNDLNDLRSAFERLPALEASVLIANTVKGYGLKEVENNYEWHHKCPNEVEYAKFMAELEQSAK